MKITTLITSAAFAFAIVSPVFADGTELDGEMEKISKALKLVNRNIAQPDQKDANLAKIAEAKAAAEKSLTLEPAKAKDIPADEKAKFIESYKAAMQEMIKTLDELKVAVEAGKPEDASKVIEKLNAGKKEGHKQFKKEE